MRRIFLDRRDGRLALYLNGDLQFDRADERLYHEPLALVPVALARARTRGAALRVLVLGGGDGLALREVLRVPEVREAHLVDRDRDVLDLARTALATLNASALSDPRARVHVRDAAAFLGRARGFDVIIHDLTYPRDVAGASLFGVKMFRRVSAALSPGGVLAVNAVSPELTPQAFGCIAATLHAAGLHARPYTFELPSFRAEGYGRWGFLLASTRPISDADIRLLQLPGGALVDPAALLAGADGPAAASAAMRAGVNRTDELLYYIANDTPLEWSPPLRRLDFERSSPVAAGPRLTAAQGFAEWLRQSAGRRSLDELLECLPLSRRGQTRRTLLEWSHYAETLYRELDLAEFVERTLRRAHRLPREWVRELRAVADRLRRSSPDFHDLLHSAYRVFAIFLLVMLVANILFPDNLYAKHTRPGSGDSADVSFSDPRTTFEPFHFRGFAAPAAGLPNTMVPDARGRTYPSRLWVFSDASGRPRSVGALLALSNNLRLLEAGVVAYSTLVPGYQFFVEPGRLRVVDLLGRDVTAVLPDLTLEADVRMHLGALGPLIDKAIADHSRWLEWVRWGSPLSAGRDAASELEGLQRIKQSIAAAEAGWAPLPKTAFMPSPRWTVMLPGIYLTPARPGEVAPTLVTVAPDGTAHERLLTPPTRLTDEDRFIFWVLESRSKTMRDPRLASVVARWREAHGGALKPPGALAAGGSWSQ